MKDYMLDLDNSNKSYPPHPLTAKEMEFLESLDGKNVHLYMRDGVLDKPYTGRFEFSYGHYTFTIGNSDNLLVDLIEINSVREV